MEALILAGGKGTRLRHLLNNKPKALANVNGVPFLSYIISLLLKNNINSFIFALGYLHEQIEQYLIDFHKDLNYKISIEYEPLGTGGAIINSLNLIDGKHFLIINADTFFDVNIGMLLDFHNKQEADCTIALKLMKNYNRYGTVVLNIDKKIEKFEEKTFNESGYINSGYILINKNILLNLTKKNFSFEIDFLEKSLNNLNLFGFQHNGYFIDIGVSEDYNKSQIDFKNILI
jgi:D-glycero-alpha-D-manno-heptose 1-phosphate guanylyltransferase